MLVMSEGDKGAGSQKFATRVYQLSADGFFVSAPKLDAGEQPDTIDRGRLAQLIAFS
jgi:hypothetical protein